MKIKKYTIKTVIVIIGSIISAYGITLAIGAGFGGATLAILWQGADKCYRNDNWHFITCCSGGDDYIRPFL